MNTKDTQEMNKTLEEKRNSMLKKVSKQFNSKQVHICMADDMHPYNCNGMFGGSCIHCESKVEKGHNPKTCALCNWDSELN